MLQTVDVGMGCLACYELSAGIDAIDQLHELAAIPQSSMSGLPVVHGRGLWQTSSRSSDYGPHALFVAICIEFSFAAN